MPLEVQGFCKCFSFDLLGLIFLHSLVLQASSKAKFYWMKHKAANIIIIFATDQPISMNFALRGFHYWLKGQTFSRAAVHFNVAWYYLFFSCVFYKGFAKAFFLFIFLFLFYCVITHISEVDILNIRISLAFCDPFGICPLKALKYQFHFRISI